MLRIMRNDWYRLLEEKAYLIVAIILTTVAVVVAILLTNKIDVKGNVAVIDESGIVAINETPYFNIEFLQEKPAKSLLVVNRYDAVVIIRKDGNYEITTLKNKEFKELLEGYLNGSIGKSYATDSKRGMGTNMIGYMLMFLLMQGTLYARFFAEEKEKHMTERVAISPIPFYKYLSGHGVFIFLMTFIPSFTVIMITKILGIASGFSIFQFAVILFILCVLSTTFALFLNSFFCVVDTANMLGSSLIVLTSILAGSFYSFTKKSSLFDKMIHILPQKDFMNFVNAWEKGALSIQIGSQLTYVIILCTFFLGVAVYKTRKQYVYKL